MLPTLPAGPPPEEHRPAMDLATRILLVDDDAGIRETIGGFLEGHGYRVALASDAAAMRNALDQERYDLVVLDVMMPGEDGLSALRRLQGQPGSPPVIMLSAVGTDIDRIVGLEIGAEDYLPKPCNPRELLARIRTVLRRTGSRELPEGVPSTNGDGRGAQTIRFAGWHLDLMSRMLHDPAGVLINLSDGEFRLLRAFVEHPRRVLTRDQLLDYARGQDAELYDRAIDVQISRLRRRLSHSGAHEELIRTIRNEGYMFLATVTKG
jgi:two-component system OmpR family response regulator